MNDKLERAIFLGEEINKLKFFLETVVTFDEKINYQTSTNVFMRQKISTKVSLFGTRYFGCGTDEQEIEVPHTLRNLIIKEAKVRLKEFESELECIFK